jgi:hypothetical protein
LELTTGKKATRGDEHSSLADWSWRHIQAESNIEELLDKEVMEPSHLDGMCGVFKLGIMCTAKLPSRRPSMKDVLHILLRCEGGIVFGLILLGNMMLSLYFKIQNLVIRLHVQIGGTPPMYV